MARKNDENKGYRLTCLNDDEKKKQKKTETESIELL